MQSISKSQLLKCAGTRDFKLILKRLHKWHQRFQVDILLYSEEGKGFWEHGREGGVRCGGREREKEVREMGERREGEQGFIWKNFLGGYVAIS